MVSTVSCPHCGKSLKTTPAFAGKVVACPYCKGHLQLPTEDSQLPAAPNAAAFEAVTRSPDPPNRSRAPAKEPQPLPGPSTAFIEEVASIAAPPTSEPDHPPVDSSPIPAAPVGKPLRFTTKGRFGIVAAVLSLLALFSGLVLMQLLERPSKPAGPTYAEALQIYNNEVAVQKDLIEKWKQATKMAHQEQEVLDLDLKIFEVAHDPKVMTAEVMQKPLLEQAKYIATLDATLKKDNNELIAKIKEGRVQKRRYLDQADAIEREEQEQASRVVRAKADKEMAEKERNK